MKRGRREGVKVKKNKEKEQQTEKKKPDLRGYGGKLRCERKGRGVCKKKKKKKEKIDLFGCEEDEEEQRGKEMKGEEREVF